MDIFIRNFPENVNQTEVRIFLRDVFRRYDILAFDVWKRTKSNYATVTAPDSNKGELFLVTCGGPNPLTPLIFRGSRLSCQRSNRTGGPDPTKIEALQEDERKARAKLSRQSNAPQTSQITQPIFHFLSLSTGTWSYNQYGALVFSSRLKDRRQGTITFGKFGLVVYLRPSTNPHHNWHCRIDIPYGIIEHTIPSFGDGSDPTITLTLTTPPKFYELLNTDDVHLYIGDQVIHMGGEMPSIGRLSLTREVKRLQRLCSLDAKMVKNSSLCMVYRLELPNLQGARQAWQHIKHCSAIPQKDCFRTTVRGVPSQAIEDDFSILQALLGNDRLFGSLGFDARYQLLALVLEGTLSPLAVAEMCHGLEVMAIKYSSSDIAEAVRKLVYRLPTPAPHVDAQDLSQTTILRTIEDDVKKIRDTKNTSDDLNQKQNHRHALISTYKAVITPTGFVLRGPDLGVSNRVLRKYSEFSEFFMRVVVSDEDGSSVLYDSRADQSNVYNRFREVLKEGISVVGRRYEFLGFSHSSLHYHTTWFMAPFQFEGRQICARDVIEDLGDFSHLQCAAKCAARIGQAFSDTMFAVPLPKDTLVNEKMEDVERNGRCFSDGCGTISPDLLKRIWRALPPQRAQQRPTVLQIRYRGAKGIVSLDPRLEGHQLLIRKSMTKFEASVGWRDIELCGASYKPLMAYLNHQFVKILEDLGVPQDHFIDIQNEALDELQRMVTHPVNAANFLDYRRSGSAAKIPILFKLLYDIRLDFRVDRFLTDLVEIAAMTSLRDMKYRARIPISKGMLLYGLMDETNYLKEDEVYISWKADEDGEMKKRILVAGQVVVTRAPALHPGDIQVVRAVDVPESSPLRALHNCIVFSQQGARDLPSQLGGGDLDGDLFHIFHDTRLIPPRTEAAADYPPTRAKDLGRKVNTDDIINFFIEYMHSDRLGQISNNHKVWADRMDEGTRHSDCLKLAAMASDAVDYTKSGNPVDMRSGPKGPFNVRPDFMSSGQGLVLKDGGIDLEDLDAIDIDNPDSLSILDPDLAQIRYYRSRKTLGVLHRRINEQNFFNKMEDGFRTFQQNMGNESLIEKLERYVNKETQILQWEHYRQFAEELREFYEENMLEIMDSLRPHSGKPLKELEVFSGNILGKKGRDMSRHTREANQEVRERFNRDVTAVISRIVKGEGVEKDEEDEALPRAIACFKVALEKEGWEKYERLKSWKYVTAAVCLERLWIYGDYRTLRPL